MSGKGAVIQLVRECPPGFGGVERVAHELAMAHHARGLPCLTVHLRRAADTREPPPLPTPYRRIRLPVIALGSLSLPWPHPRLLRVLLSPQPLQIHLPCPTLLLIGIAARLLRHRRRIEVHWHAFLEPGPAPWGWGTGLYQWLALRWVAMGSDRVITTSPVLAAGLAQEGVPGRRLEVLPCCLPAETEKAALRIRGERRHRPPRRSGEPFRVIYIGRLASYKRVDWLIEAVHRSAATTLHIVGEGPRRRSLERLAAAGARADAIRFHGRLNEEAKLRLLAASDLLVLPSDRSNEAFGIAQLEAMACGVPALALPHPRSGMAWVGGLEETLATAGTAERERDRLLAVIRLFVASPPCWGRAAEQARRRYERLFARAVWERRLVDLMAWSS